MLEQLNEPKWQTVDRSQPVVLAAPKKVTPKKSKHTVHIALPDPQIGYRDLDSGLDPFHDESAMDVALQITSFVEETDSIRLSIWVTSWIYQRKGALNRKLLLRQPRKKPLTEVTCFCSSSDRRPGQRPR